MKKLIIAMMLLSSTIFASEFKYYKGATIERCTEKLNELSKSYHIISYKLVPYWIMRASWIEEYNMIIEVEKKGGSEC